MYFANKLLSLQPLTCFVSFFFFFQLTIKKEKVFFSLPSSHENEASESRENFNLIKSWLESTVLCFGREKEFLFLFHPLDCSADDVLYSKTTLVCFSPVEHLFILLFYFTGIPSSPGLRDEEIFFFFFTLNMHGKKKARACIIITVKADFFLSSKFSWLEKCAFETLLFFVLLYFCLFSPFPFFFRFLRAVVWQAVQI